MTAVAETKAPACVAAIARGPIRLASAVAPATYTADQLAALLQVCPRQVWRMKDAGLLPAHIQIGRLVRWERAATEEWIRAGCPRPKGR
jgi:predicted DNA-binding transcriptional regulator AlpA